MKAIYSTWLVFLLSVVVPEAAAQALYSDGFEARCGRQLLREDFATDGDSWPAPWRISGGVAAADVVNGEARFRPTPSDYSLARLFAPAFAVDTDATFEFVLENADTQGAGFYVRHNTAYLAQETPGGRGYAMFIEGGFRGLPGIGVWKEEAGAEIPLHHSDGIAGPQSGVRYRARVRVHQLDAGSTRLQARFWPADEAEPLDWQTGFDDTTPSLQAIGGHVLLDAWDVRQVPSEIPDFVRVDAVDVQVVCSPLAGLGERQTISDDLQFSEGPLWRGDHLLFSDITADTVYRLDPPGNIQVFRQPSQGANGLAEFEGQLYAAEQFSRRVSVSGPAADAAVESLIERFEGSRFSAPNDLVFRSDGTLYFSDPEYGLVDAPNQRELAFNGLFRLPPEGPAVVEWQGPVGASGPNGVALSPDERWLYLADSETGRIERFAVASDGSLGDPGTFAQGLTIPDGLCVDPAGNLFVATWRPSIEVFSPDGGHWGSIELPRPATNCAFGGDDGNTLYVTAQQSLYSFQLGSAR